MTSRWGEQTWAGLKADGWTFEKVIIPGSEDDHCLWTKPMKAMKANPKNDKKGKDKKGMTRTKVFAVEDKTNTKAMKAVAVKRNNKATPKH